MEVGGWGGLNFVLSSLGVGASLGGEGGSSANSNYKYNHGYSECPHLHQNWLISELGGAEG